MDVYINNNQKVVLSGTVVSIGDDPVRFVLHQDFVVVFRFFHDDSVNGKQRRHEVVKNELIISFINYENALWVTNSAQEHLGTLQGRPLLMNFAISFIGSLESHSRIISYTFCQGA